MRTQFNPQLVARIEPEYTTFMAKAEPIRWSPDTIDYSKVDHSKLTIGDLFGVFVTLHIENYSDVYTKLLIQSYADVPLIQKFILNWEKEEENHARVLEKYLTSLGIPLEELRANYAMVNKDDFPWPSNNQTGLNVFVYLQELFTREMYTKMLKTCKEPVLIDILKRVVRDEERHFRFYKQSLGMRFEIDRKDTFKQFEKIIRIFGMPQTMFRQPAMTDKLMEFFPFGSQEIKSIMRPIEKVLEASPSRLLNRFPKLQALWQKRRMAWYAIQSPYLRGHAWISLKHALGIKIVSSKEDKEYVEKVIERLKPLIRRAGHPVSDAASPAPKLTALQA